MKTGVLCVLVLACVRASLGHVMFVKTPEGRRSPRSVENTEGQQSTSSPEMTSLHIESTILYRYAKTSVASRLANKAEVAREISFSAILPQSAFISAFHIEMDGQVYHAYVKEKEEAHAEYSHAVSEGRTAAKVDLTIRDSNRFTVSVNVEASAKVTFNLTYEELLTRRLGVYSNVINIDPGQVVPDLSVLVHIEESNSLASLRVPTLRETNEISSDDSQENDPLAVIERPAPNRATISWRPSAKQQVERNGVKGHLEVEYDVERQDNPSQILVSDGYFVHFYSPSDLTPLNKLVVFVLDISGSMEGSKLRQLKEAMRRILSDLREDDFFSIAAFSERVQVWHPSRGNVEVINFRDDSWLAPELIVPVTPDNIRKAKEYVNNLEDLDITNIYDALMTSLEIVKLGRKEFEKFKLNGKPRQMPEPMVIFLTDGQANVGESNTETIVKRVTEKNKRKASIFSLSFGRDADIGFLKKLSLKNSAFSRLIYEASDAALQLSDFYRQIASPLLVNVTFQYKSNQVENETLTNLHFNTLFGGSELVVSGKLAPESEQLSGILLAKSFTGKSRYIFPSPTIIRQPARRNVTAPSFMEKLWAYLNIQQLLDQHALEDGGNSTSKERALALALKYSFVTPLTSLVVVKPNETSRVDTEEAGVEASGSRRGGVLRTGYSGVYPRIGLSANRKHISSARQPSHASSSSASASVPESLSADSLDTRSTNHAPIMPTALLPQILLTLDDLTWTTPDTNNGSHVFITRNSQTVAFEIGKNQTNTVHGSCDSGSSVPSHCRHLPYCVLPAFATDFSAYVTAFFCEINGFAGSCCPDNQPSPASSA